jgi:hypothetical protein
MAPWTVTFSEWVKQYHTACRTAWLGEYREPVPVLPPDVWPGLVELINPITRFPVTVRRQPLFEWGAGISPDRTPFVSAADES